LAAGAGWGDQRLDVPLARDVGRKPVDDLVILDDHDFAAAEE